MKKTVAILTVGVACGVAAIFGALVIAESSGSASGRFERVSNIGAPVAASTPDLAALRSAGATGATLRVLGKRGDMHFFTALARQGGVCHGLGTAPGRFAVIACPNENTTSDNAFPSETHPILDFSARAFDPRTGYTERVLSLAGVAADGIAKVGIIDDNGVRHLAPVEYNLYRAPLPEVGAKALIALDESGREVYRSSFEE